MAEFGEISLHMNTVLPTNFRKKHGIYFTPLSARCRIFEKLEDFKVNPKTILEPSFGSGEFLNDTETLYPNATIYGVELCKELYDAYPESSTLTNTDFLNYHAEPVDLVIGNPPYVVTTIKSECQKGRGNLFVLFIYKCLTEHMKEGSVLAFVLPTSFYNCSYYEPCRRYISEHSTVLHLETIDVKYYETGQKTMILILRKESPKNTDFILTRGESIYITPKYLSLRQLSQTTLRDLGFTVKTGDVVWNQEKEKLSDTGSLIIYTTNIVNNKLVFPQLKGEKKQYIQGFKKKITVGPAIVVSRGYGNNYLFSWAVVASGTEFYGENHINVITGPAEHFNRVVTSFTSSKTQDFIDMFVGNGALSKTELESILPIL